MKESLGYFCVEQTLRFPKALQEEVEEKVHAIPGVRVGAGALYGFPDAIQAASDALALPWTPVRMDRKGFEKTWAQVRDAGNAYGLRKYQHDGLDQLTKTTLDCTGALLADDMGLGKGLCYGERMLTPRGWTTAAQVKVGDMLIGRSGLPIRVVGRYPQGVRQTYRVTFSDGVSVVTDDQHLWSVQTANWRTRTPDKWTTYSTAELRGDLKQGANAKWFVPLLSAPVEHPPVELPVAPYLLGVLLGDGALGTATPTIHINGTNKKGIREAISQHLPHGDKLGVNAHPHTISIVGGATAKGLRALGLFGLTSPQKFVPPGYLVGSVPQRLGLLRGLMDTDGWCSNGCTQFGSSSENLRDAVVTLVQSLGGTARKGLKAEPKYTYKGEKRTGLPSYTATIAMPEGVNPFRVRARGYAPHMKYQPSRAIVSIDPEGKEETVCFKVDAPDELFVIDHYVVTHNTRTACAWLKVFGIPTRTSLVVCPASVREQWVAELSRPDVVVLGPRTKTARSQWAWQCAASGVPGVYVTSYNLAGAALDCFPQPPTCLVVDEAHNIKGRKNPWSKTLLEAAPLVPYRLALTGTPIFSRTADLWTVLKFLFNKRFGSGWEFDRRYCNGHEGPYGWVNKGESNQAELKARLACYTVRRTKGEVLDELPALSRSVRWVEPTPAARAAFTSALAGSMGDGALADALAATLAGKLDETVAYCTQLGAPFLCFTYLREHCQELARRIGEEGVKVYAIDGEQSAEERRATLEKAKSEGASVVATLGSMSTGVNAQGIGSYGVFHALSWVPAELMQAEARLHRMGQRDAVHWTYICMRDSMDEHVVRTVVDRLTTWTKTMTHTGDGSADMRADFAGGGAADTNILAAIWASATGTDDGGD